MREDNLINYICNNSPNHLCDDAALLKKSRRTSYVISKDILIEDVHFRLSYFDPESLAIKALNVNLSDIAAMGATPVSVLLGISVPNSYRDKIYLFLSSFLNECKRLSISLDGGDITKSHDKLFLSVTVIGIVKTKLIKYRKNACVGDYVCVAGNLGYSHCGFLALEKKQYDLLNYKNFFLQPRALLTEGVWLAKHSGVTSMMDISDGLFVDLKKLCKASCVCAEIKLELMKQQDAKFYEACDILNISSMDALLFGGEDYGLLFTVKSSCYKRLNASYLKKFGCSIKCVGIIHDGSGVMLTDFGKAQNIKGKPFCHFNEF